MEGRYVFAPRLRGGLASRDPIVFQQLFAGKTSADTFVSSRAANSDAHPGGMQVVVIDVLRYGELNDIKQRTFLAT